MENCRVSAQVFLNRFCCLTGYLHGFSQQMRCAESRKLSRLLCWRRLNQFGIPRGVNYRSIKLIGISQVKGDDISCINRQFTTTTIQNL